MTGSSHGRGADQVSLRLPDGMRDRIKAAADENGRSMNAEIVATLEEKYPPPPSDVISFEEAVRIYKKWRDENYSEEDLAGLSSVSKAIISQVMIYETEFSKEDAVPEKLISYWRQGRKDALSGVNVSQRIVDKSLDEWKAWWKGYRYERFLMDVRQSGAHLELKNWLGKTE